MTWSNQKPPGLDDIFDRHGSPHAIAGEAIAVVDENAHLSLSNELAKAAPQRQRSTFIFHFAPVAALAATTSPLWSTIIR